MPHRPVLLAPLERVALGVAAVALAVVMPKPAFYGLAALGALIILDGVIGWLRERRG